NPVPELTFQPDHSMGAGQVIWYAIKALAIRAHHTVHTVDVMALVQSKEPFADNLVKKLLVAVRRNRDQVNLRVSYADCSKEFLVRMIIILGVSVAWSALYQGFMLL
ncbi:MAG: hypothetical protein WD711_03680, partial [Dongiaceae bacterium]